MEVSEKIEVLMEIIHCSCPLDYWLYAPDGVLIRSTSDTEHMLDVILKRTECFAYLRSTIERNPVILAGKRNVRWIAVKQERGGEITAYHILGPFLSSNIPDGGADPLVPEQSKNYPQQWIQRLTEILDGLSIIPIQSFTQYAVILHKLVNEELVPESSVHHQPIPTPHQYPSIAKANKEAQIKDRMPVYLAEQQLLHAVKEGDTDSAAAASLMAKNQVGRIREYTGDPLLNYKIACTTFTAICVRAAIEGGLSPSRAYPIGDNYIRKIFQATNPEYIAELKNHMYFDFISYVHELRINPTYSKAVQSCCDYIQLHPAEALSIEFLAGRLGYSKYYLSALFKKETGCSIGDYIKIARVERAKVLLASTNINVESIWGTVGFSSRSAFGKAFHSVVGMTPREYRDQKLRL